MTENLQAPLREPIEIKIFILYLMSHIDRPLDYAEIYEIVIQNGVVKPFDFCLNFPDLLETGHIVMNVENGREIYTVTARGRETEESLGGKILNMTKEKALQNAILSLNMKKKNEEYHYHTEAIPGGGYRFCLSYEENGKETIALSVRVETIKEAENLENSFEQHTDFFRRALLSLLSNSVQRVAEYDPYLLL